MKHPIEPALIAPCGIDCALCWAYQAGALDLKKKGFHRTYCPGCLPLGKEAVEQHCRCEILRSGQVRFCFECDRFPCPFLKRLDKRYRTKYHQSPIENLRSIQKNGLQQFLEAHEKTWACPKCGESMICCHNGLCLRCELDVLKQNRRYRWGEQDEARKP